jgi:hypothetical protein
MHAKRFSTAVLVGIAVLGAISLMNQAGCEIKKIYVAEMNDSKKPAFPDSCVVCGQPRGERLSTLTMSDEHGRVDFYLYKLPIAAAQGSHLEIPVHDTCAKGVRNDFLKRFALIALVAVSIAAAGVLNQYGAFYSLMAALVVATPFLYLQFTKPVPVEFNHYAQKYVLMFKDRNYAEDFARLNGVEVREGTDPYTGTPVKTGPIAGSPLKSHLPGGKSIR